jgi:hypothetical protein
VIGWQAELALCDWLVESRDPVEGTRVFPPFPLCPVQLDPGVAGIRTVCRELQRRGGAVRRRSYSPFWSEVFCGVALNNVSNLQVQVTSKE